MTCTQPTLIDWLEQTDSGESHLPECRHCEKRFIPKASDRRTYCSRECAFTEKREWAVINRWQAGLARPLCIICDGSLPAKRQQTCGRECEKEHARRKARTDYYTRVHQQLGIVLRDRCSVCRGVIPGEIRHGNRMYCSARCNEKASRKRNRATVNAAMRRRKHRLRDATIEVVCPIKVFNRDGWACWLCKNPTDPGAGVGTPRYPTLDHVIPLSKGGEHSYANVRCACHECNSRKSDTLITDTQTSVDGGQKV